MYSWKYIEEILYQHFYFITHSPSLANQKGEPLFQYSVIIFHGNLVQGTSSRAYKYCLLFIKQGTSLNKTSKMSHQKGQLLCALILPKAT